MRQRKRGGQGRKEEKRRRRKEREETQERIRDGKKLMYFGNGVVLKLTLIFHLWEKKRNSTSTETVSVDVLLAWNVMDVSAECCIGVGSSKPS